MSCMYIAHCVFSVGLLPRGDVHPRQVHLRRGLARVRMPNQALPQRLLWRRLLLPWRLSRRKGVGGGGAGVVALVAMAAVFRFRFPANWPNEWANLKHLLFLEDQKETSHFWGNGGYSRKSHDEVLLLRVRFKLHEQIGVPHRTHPMATFCKPGTR